MREINKLEEFSKNTKLNVREKHREDVENLIADKISKSKKLALASIIHSWHILTINSKAERWNKIIL